MSADRIVAAFDFMSNLSFIISEILLKITASPNATQKGRRIGKNNNIAIAQIIKTE